MQERRPLALHSMFYSIVDVSRLTGLDQESVRSAVKCGQIRTWTPTGMRRPRITCQGLADWLNSIGVPALAAPHTSALSPPSVEFQRAVDASALEIAT